MLNNNDNIELNLGDQPIKQKMIDHGLKPHDLVEVSTDQLTHRMVARACKGRRLTLNVQRKVLDALNKSANKSYVLNDLFNYKADR